jgi:hypothetical protein
MENNSLSSTLLQAKPSTPISTQSYTTSNTGFFGGIFESIQNISFTTWLIIILILAFLGFNIFIYLAKGTQDITSFFNTITKMVSGNNNASVKEVKKPDTTHIQPVIEKKPDSVANATLNKSINTSKPEDPEDDYKAHDASSSLDITGKSGWCYIGEDKGFRTCAQVGVNDKCMSGDIFPSQEICINSNLRS